MVVLYTAVFVVLELVYGILLHRTQGHQSVWFEKHYRVPQPRLPSAAKLLAVALPGAVSFFIVDALTPDTGLVHFMAGALLGHQAVLVGAGLRNLRTIRWVQKNPDEISGSIEFGREWIVSKTQSDWLALLPLIFVIAGLSPSPFVGGMLLTGVMNVVLARSVTRVHYPPSQEAVSPDV